MTVSRVLQVLLAVVFISCTKEESPSEPETKQPPQSIVVIDSVRHSVELSQPEYTVNDSISVKYIITGIASTPRQFTFTQAEHIQFHIFREDDGVATFFYPKSFTDSTTQYSLATNETRSYTVRVSLKSGSNTPLRSGAHRIRVWLGNSGTTYYHILPFTIR
ncbi:MAG: hypothetical protein HUU02_10695 [Bacteroidetes bacterium]|nr:hypothetical protein [Bacteroidota bacterium]